MQNGSEDIDEAMAMVYGNRGDCYQVSPVEIVSVVGVRALIGSYLGVTIRPCKTMKCASTSSIKLERSLTLLLCCLQVALNPGAHRMVAP